MVESIVLDVCVSRGNLPGENVTGKNVTGKNRVRLRGTSVAMKTCQIPVFHYNLLVMIYDRMVLIHKHAKTKKLARHLLFCS